MRSSGYGFHTAVLALNMGGILKNKFPPRTASEGRTLFHNRPTAVWPIDWHRYPVRFGGKFVKIARFAPKYFSHILAGTVGQMLYSSSIFLWGPLANRAKEVFSLKRAGALTVDTIRGAVVWCVVLCEPNGTHTPRVSLAHTERRAALCRESMLGCVWAVAKRR